MHERKAGKIETKTKRTPEDVRLVCMRVCTRNPYFTIAFRACGGSSCSATERSPERRRRVLSPLGTIITSASFGNCFATEAKRTSPLIFADTILVYVPKLRFSSKYSDVLSSPHSKQPCGFGLLWGPQKEKNGHKNRSFLYYIQMHNYHAVPSILRYDLYLHCAFSCAAANNSSASLGNCLATDAKRTSPFR